MTSSSLYISSNPAQKTFGLYEASFKVPIIETIYSNFSLTDYKVFLYYIRELRYLDKGEYKIGPSTRREAT